MDEKLKGLLEELFSKKITRKGHSIGDYQTEVVVKEGQVIVEQMIRQFLLDNRDEKVGILEAKVFAYEKIISNSNFAPMLDKNRLGYNSKGNYESNN